MKDFRDMVYLMTFVLLVILTFITCTGCSLKPSPAKQQQITNIPQATIAVSPDTGVPVAELDQDGDGTIAADELKRLQPQSTSVLATFSIIVGAVVVVSVACAIMARGRRRGDPG